MKFESLIAKAEAAGMAAAQGAKVEPMVVGTPTSVFGSQLDYTKPVYFVEGGPCGFAWIKVSGKSAFGRYAKKIGKARPDYPSGLAISVREFGQSMQRKEAYAYAYAAVLREAGIEAFAESRMD